MKPAWKSAAASSPAQDSVSTSALTPSGGGKRNGPLYASGRFGQDLVVSPSAIRKNEYDLQQAYQIRFRRASCLRCVLGFGVDSRGGEPKGHSFGLRIVWGTKCVRERGKGGGQHCRAPHGR